MQNDLLPQSTSFKKREWKKPVLIIFFIILLIFILIWLVWPLFQYLRTGRISTSNPITTTIQQVVTDPRATLLGTNLSLNTIIGEAGKGEKGDKGDTGPPGTNGIDGLEGDVGPAGLSESNAVLQNGNSYGEKIIIGSNDSEDLSFETNGSNALTIDTSGNVRIERNGLSISGRTILGTASAGNSSLNIPSSSGINVTSPSSGDLWWNGTNLYFRTGSSTVDLLAGGGGGCGGTCFEQNGNSFGAQGVLGTNDANSLAFETNNVTRMQFDTSGNLVATANPGANIYGYTLTSNPTSGDNSGGLNTVFNSTHGASTFMLSTGLKSDYTYNSADVSQGRISGNNSNVTISNGSVRGASAYAGILTNNATLAGAFGMIGNDIELNNNGTAQEYKGIQQILSNAGTITSGVFTSMESEIFNDGNAVRMNGIQIFPTNNAAGTLSDILAGLHADIENDGTVGSDEFAAQLFTRGNGTVGGSAYGYSFDDLGSQTITGSVYGLHLGLSSTNIVNTAYGIQVNPLIAAGAVNNYGLYLGGASGGSGTNASLWVNAGLSRFAPATSAASSINLANSSGVNPSSPTTGDLWWNGTNLNFRAGGSTVDLLAGGGGGCGGTCFEQGGNSFGATAVLGTTDTNDLQFITDGTTQMSLTTAGWLGLGTTGPGSRLQIEGDFDTDNTGAVALDLNGLNNGGSILAISQDGVGTWGLGMDPASDEFGIFADRDASATGTKVFGIANNGLVEINSNSNVSTTNNYDTLHVSDNNPVITLEAPGFGVGYLGLDASNGTVLGAEKNIYFKTGVGFGFGPVVTGDTRMYIDNVTGDVAIGGSTTPDSKLYVSADDTLGNYVAQFIHTGDDGANNGILVQTGENTPTTENRLVTFLDGDGDEVGSIDFDAANTNYNTTSDLRLKKDITATNLGLDTLMQIPVVDFNWINRSNADKTHGFIAQDLYNIYPQAVSKPVNPDSYWQVDFSKLTPLIIKSIQDQEASISAINKKVDELNAPQTNPISEIKEFINEILFKAKTTFLAEVQFLGNVIFKNRVTFADKDMGGSVVINAGETSAHVTFSNPFAKAPVVTVTPQGQVVSVAVDAVSANGFKVIISNPLSNPLTISWTALSIDYSDVEAATPAPANPTNTPTPSTAPLPSPSPSSDPAPIAIPEPTVSPVETPLN